MKMFSKLAIEITEQYVAHLFKINHKTPKLPVFLVLFLGYTEVFQRFKKKQATKVCEMFFHI